MAVRGNETIEIFERGKRSEFGATNAGPEVILSAVILAHCKRLLIGEGHDAAGFGGEHK